MDGNQDTHPSYLDVLYAYACGGIFQEGHGHQEHDEPKLKMERRNVYSRAYDKELCRTGLKSKARTFANLEVQKWEATSK